MDKQNTNLSFPGLFNRSPHCARKPETADDVYYNKKVNEPPHWAWWLNHGGTLFIFIIGFCGNVLCLLVLLRPRLRRTSYTQYLIALAIFDTGSLTFEVLSTIDKLYQNLNKSESALLQHNRISCKLYSYIQYIFYSMSSWVIVALAIERLVAIRFPLWAKYICNVLNARRILLAILLFAICIESYLLVTRDSDCSVSLSSKNSSSANSSSTNSSKPVCRCKTLKPYGKLEVYFTIYVWRLSLLVLLPLVIILAANILIMNKLFSEHSLIDHSNASDNRRRKSVLLFKISRMLVILSSVYLLLHLPGSVLDVLKHLVQTFDICSARLEYYIYIANEICDLLTNINYGINFYLYIISGKHIRNELMRAFKRRSSHSTGSRHSGKFPRSSYFAPSYKHASRKSPPLRRGTEGSI